jgi:hypothetical protein
VQSKYGKPIYVSESDDLQEKLAEYEESISSLKFQMIESNGIHRRDTISNEDYIKFLREMYKAIELSKVDKQKERACIFRAGEEFYQFFHMNDIPFDEFGNFLETDEVRRLLEIEQKNEIQKWSNILKFCDINENERKEIINCIKKKF